MIAKIIPAIRIPQDGPFDYSIPDGTPPPEPGSLVRVRFRGKATVGLVVGVTETSEVAPSRLLPIEDRVFDGQAVMNAFSLHLLPRLAAHYCVPLPLLLLQLLPKIPVKVALPLGSGNDPSYFLSEASSEVEGLPLDDGRTGPTSSLVMLDSAFDAEKVRTLVTDELQVGPLLVLAPTVGHATWLKETILGITSKVELYHGALAPKRSALAWTSLATGAMDVLVATRSGVMAPLPPNGRIMIFAEDEPSFIQFDAEPRFDARFVARERAKAEGRSLVNVSEAPTLAAYASSSSRLMEVKDDTDLTVIRLDDERRGGFKGVFADQTVIAIYEIVKDGKDVIVCANRKGTALAVRCADCWAAIECDACSLPMRSFGHTSRCVRCDTSRETPTTCPKCGGSRLRDRGLTATRAVEELKALFPDVEVREVESEASLFESERPTIFVGTEMLVHSLRAKVETLRIGAVIVPHAEQLFGLGDYSDSEDGYTLLRALQALATRQNGRFILQTYSAEHPAILALRDAPEAFYEQGLSEREEFGYPPAWTYLKVTSPEVMASDEAKNALKSRLPDGARLDFSGDRTYISRFKPGDSIVPQALKTLGKGWVWRANPRYTNE